MKLAKLTTPPITAWSPSRLFSYEECPFKTRLKVVEKMKEPDNPAAARGTSIDEGARHFMEGRTKVLMPELKLVKKALGDYRNLFKARSLKCNVELALTREWRVTDWFNKNTWLRAKLDVLILRPKKLVEVVDLKSGKLRTENGDKYEDQVRIYNVSVLSAGMGDRAKASLLFTDHGVQHSPPNGRAELTRGELKAEQAQWEKRVKPMLNDKVFVPRPGNQCRWCHFRKSNGGPCVY